MNINELNNLARSQPGNVNCLLVHREAPAESVLLIYPPTFDPFFDDFPFRVVCRQADAQVVTCCFLTFSNLFHEVQLRSRAEALNMLQLVTRLDFVACQGFPEPRSTHSLPLSELLIDKQSAGWVYRSRQCLYLTSQGFSICNFCAALQKRVEVLDELPHPKAGDQEASTPAVDPHPAEGNAANSEPAKAARTVLRGRPRLACFSCPAAGQCSETFSSRAAVGRHVRLSHSELYRCSRPGCRKSFSSDAALQLHARRHAGLFAFACAHCKRGFVSQKEVNMHEKIHTKGRLKELTCSLCTRSFATKHKLKLHMTLHTGEQNHSCQTCNRKFTRRSHMVEHVRRVHTERRDHKCSVCEKEFSARQQLQRHQRTHTGERPFACRFCAQTFSRSHHVAIHVERKHSEPRYDDAGAKDLIEEEEDNSHLEIITTTVEAVGLYLEVDDLPVI